jgi:CDP-diglyceride synthetase
VTGLQKTLSENRILNHFRNLRLSEKLLLQGLITVVILIAIQAWFYSAQDSFMNYMPPLGFAFLLAITYFAQPIILGTVNIALINSLHKTRGWQVGFWLNGILLVLAFSTLNLVLQVTFNLPFLPSIAIIDLLLSFPFGCLARFSNGGWNKPID